MRTCTLIGIGMGNPATLTQEARDALAAAPLVAGAERVLAAVQHLVRGKTLAAFDARTIAAAFAAADGTPCAVFSGDTGFYSGATGLRALLESEGWTVRTLCGITTAQYFAARIGEPWQEWHLASAHGTDCDLGIALSYAPRTFFLTGGSITVRAIAQFLLDRECDATLTVGSRLSYSAAEHIFSGSPAEILARDDYDERLACVLVTHAVPDLPRAALPDDFFVRSRAPLIPMTKQFVRAAALALLAVRDGETVWDIGAGTGAVSMDLARSAHCAVYAVEQLAAACALIRQNRTKAGAVNVAVCPGRAPQVLSGLPAPAAVFVGGSDGDMDAILRAVYQKNPAARVVAACVTLETLAQLQATARALGRDYEAAQLSVARTKAAGAYHLLAAQNPVWLVTLHS
ncbi:MAG: precorrin-6y C5,15-methyltransferase (decarboxylating) subunit CbiE [Treponemataceae bacterium]|nr:precorrin-6y C5,15-methyltransferase (decarboxylating) subunit CbiE [Treponemataceae bacterium]